MKRQAEELLVSLTSLTGSISSRMGRPTAMQARQKGHGGSTKSVYALSVMGSMSCNQKQPSPLLSDVSRMRLYNCSGPVLAACMLASERGIELDIASRDSTSSCCHSALGMVLKALSSEMRKLGGGCPDETFCPGKALL